MKMLRFLFWIGLVLLSGCWVDVTVEGKGTVTSTGGINCDEMGGPLCSLEYTQAAQETFTATPEPGWEFVRWEDNPSLPVCDGVTDPVCVYNINEDLAGPEFQDSRRALKAKFQPEVSCE